MSDSIRISSSDLLILNRTEFEDNFHYLQGSCMTFFNVLSNSEDTNLICRLFEWQMKLFSQFPTEMGLANANLMFAFLGMYASSKQAYKRMKAKIIYALKEADCDESIVEWFENGGKDSCFGKTEDEWFKVIVEIISSDYRNCDQINTLLAQGQGTDYDRIAIRVKGILDGVQHGDNHTFVIRKVMERLKII